MVYIFKKERVKKKQQEYNDVEKTNYSYSIFFYMLKI
jgi:hypothetical protein